MIARHFNARCASAKARVAERRIEGTRPLVSRRSATRKQYSSTSPLKRPGYFRCDPPGRLCRPRQKGSGLFHRYVRKSIKPCTQFIQKCIEKIPNFACDRPRVERTRCSTQKYHPLRIQFTSGLRDFSAQNLLKYWHAYRPEPARIVRRLGSPAGSRIENRASGLRRS